MRLQRLRFVLAIAITGVTAGAVAAPLLACDGAGDPEPVAEQPAAPPPAAPSGASADARAEAERIFAERCATCHGPQGMGDGPASAGLTPPPRDFQDPAWQQSVTDGHIENIVLYGGAAVGKSPSMPANPDLLAKRDVVAALRDHIRGLGR